jgi:NADP-dependent 3-hydroxy acid dehydrogenase YdfG
MRNSIWKKLKVRRRLPLGVVTLEFSFSKTTKLNSGSITSDLCQSNAEPPRQLFVHNKEIGNPLPTQISNLNTKKSELTVLVGVGASFGYALAQRIAQESHRIVLVSRNTKKLKPLMNEMRELGCEVTAYSCDVTIEQSVKNLFLKLIKNHGAPDLVVYGIQSFGPGNTTNIEVPAFEDGWKHNCLGAFLISRAAANCMLPKAKGTIILIGSTSSIIGRSGHLNLVAGKFGQRGLAQVLSREMWPKGIHVCHMMIDADIRKGTIVDGAPPHSDPDDIAESIVFLHKQPKTAWTSELDIRPWNESFWEHC